MTKFAVVSDVHAEQHPDWSRLVFERMAARADLDFVAFLGDTCTSPGDSWEQHWRPLQDLLHCPIYPCRGNHDQHERWAEWWHKPDRYVKREGNADCVFFDSEQWDQGMDKWLADILATNVPHKFLFTHYPVRLGHWRYGFGTDATNTITEICRRANVTAYFSGHEHGFDVLSQDGTLYFIAGGGGGQLNHHGFEVMHRSNFYLLIETDPFNVTLCQQHRNHEQLRPMTEWINETRRPAF